MLLKLRVTNGSNAGKEIVVGKEKFLIGRADDCNLRPHSDAISRHHCVIINSAKGVGVRDLKSRNGTVVNGKKIISDKRLRNGDTLEVGPLSFDVILEKTPADVAPKDPVNGSAGKVVDGGIGGMVSQWLEEADDVAREEQRIGTPETREYRSDETSQIELNQPQTADEEAETPKQAAGDKKKMEASTKQKKKTATVPKFAVQKDEPKDTQEAAQQVLRKLFDRH